LEIIKRIKFSIEYNKARTPVSFKIPVTLSEVLNNCHLIFRQRERSKESEVSDAECCCESGKIFLNFEGNNKE
jgi:hypothetical protein